MIKYIILLPLFLSFVSAKDYLLQYSQKNDLNVSQQYITFEKNFIDTLETYKQNISNKWPVIEISTPSKWVQYSSNYTSKKVIDFKKKKITVETISSNIKTAQENMEILYKEILSLDIKNAFKNDNFNKILYSKLKIVADIRTSNHAVIYDLINNTKKDKIINEILLQEYEVVKLDTNNIYKSTYYLDKEFTLNKYIINKELINTYAIKNNIPKEILTAIIHTNTYFNPLAIDYKNIKYGLLQVNPKNIANKSYEIEFGHEKFITSKYLYDLNNNLNLASIYINDLYNNKFRDIKDINSKTYCTIIAYRLNENTIKDIFGKQDTIKKINALPSSKVFRKILKKLLFKKDKIYFSKIIIQIKKYK